MTLEVWLPSGLANDAKISMHGWPPKKHPTGPSYFIATATIAEERFFPRVVKAVASQTFPPILWVILDQSISRYAIRAIESCEDLLPSTVVISKPSAKYDWLAIGRLISSVFRFAYPALGELALVPDFAAVLDGDMAPEPTYFETLAQHFERDIWIGTVSGMILVRHGSSWIPESNSAGLRGGARMYKTQCLREIGGFPETPSPETIFDIKASRRGWRATAVDNARCFGLRETFGSEKHTRAFLAYGRGRYILNYHPVPAFATMVLLAMREGPEAAIGFIIGYLSGWWMHETKVQDTEIQLYFGSSWKSRGLVSSLRAVANYFRS